MRYEDVKIGETYLLPVNRVFQYVADGSTVRVDGVEDTGYHHATVVSVPPDYAAYQAPVGRPGVLVAAADLEPLPAAAPTFRVGDRVRVKTEGGRWGHAYSKDDTVEIVEVEDGGYLCEGTSRRTGDRSRQIVPAEELEAIEPTPVPAPEPSIPVSVVAKALEAALQASEDALFIAPSDVAREIARELGFTLTPTTTWKATHGLTETF